MELFKEVFLVGGLKEFVRLLCLFGVFLLYIGLLGDTLGYFTKRGYYTNLVRHKNIPAIFHCIRSYFFLLIHIWIIIVILIWAWR